MTTLEEWRDHARSLETEIAALRIDHQSVLTDALEAHKDRLRLRELLDKSFKLNERAIAGWKDYIINRDPLAEAYFRHIGRKERERG